MKRSGRKYRSFPDDSAKGCWSSFQVDDIHVGKLEPHRVYQGTSRKGHPYTTLVLEKSERVSRLMIMKADTREDIEVAHSGDICALIGVKDVATGDTLADKELDIRFEP